MNLLQRHAIIKAKLVNLCSAPADRWSCLTEAAEPIVVCSLYQCVRSISHYQSEDQLPKTGGRLCQLPYRCTAGAFE